MVAGIKMLGASDKSGSAEIQTKFETIDVAPGAVLTYLCWMLSLDEIVFRTALAKARSLVKRGYRPDVAVALTCAGSWEKHSERILTILRVEEETGLV